MALNAIYEACSVIEKIVTKCTDDGRLDATSAEGYLKTLRQWGHSLPAVLRRRHSGSMASDYQQGRVGYQEAIIGNLHVAGVYYFGVILLTRQFLVDHIMPRIKGQPRAVADSQSPAVAELSQACVDAAIFLGNICYEACEAGALRGNMCLMKYEHWHHTPRSSGERLTHDACAGRGSLPLASSWASSSLPMAKESIRRERHSGEQSMCLGDRVG